MVITITDLEKQIEEKRSEMIQIGMMKGLAHPVTVKLSQELDQLIIKAQGK